MLNKYRTIINCVLCGKEKEIYIKNPNKYCSKECYGNYRKKYGPSKETREKTSKALKGRFFSEEHRKKLSESQKGKIISKETREKISKGNKGKIISKEIRLKISKTLKGHEVSEETRRKISETQKGKIISKETRRKMSESRKGKPSWNKGIPHSKEHRANLSKAKIGKVPWITGKKHSEKSKKQMRISAIERIENSINNGGQVTPNYNSAACKIFDRINSHFTYSGAHAENGGEYHIKELGYFPDFYDSSSNLIIEFNEKHHYINSNILSEKDIKREQEIIEYLDCDFIRINAYDTNSLFCEVISGDEKLLKLNEMNTVVN